MAETPIRYRRPSHTLVQTILQRLDAATMAANACYFGGGTRTVLELGEYRESKDLDFLCADMNGYRELRTIVVERGLQGLFRQPVNLLREARSDMYGIRAVIDVDEVPFKIEILLEARLKTLEEDKIRCNGVAQLSRESAFAEKFLANADRALDSSTLARDVIDLAFMAEHWGMDAARAGLLLADGAYSDVRAKLDLAVNKIQSDGAWRKHCERGLSVDRPKVLRAGLEKLQPTKWRNALRRKSASV